jgi:hypothetical protein
MVVRIRGLAGVGAVALLAVLAVASPRVADAGEAAPTAAELARAKQAYADGKKLHDAGKLAEAIEKFKQSYELSRNPLLLYDIGLTMQELGSDDLAVVYYRRFLAAAPADAAQRPDAAARIDALARKLGTSNADGRAPTTDDRGPDAVAADAGGASLETGASVALPRDGELQHHPIDAAPPGQPLDLTAEVPAASQLKLTLLFRATGQAQFTSTPMLPHGDELVARIPASRMTGRALQYYVEARDASGALVARSGKSTVPHVIAIDAGAAARFFPDVAEPVLTPQPLLAGGHDGEDPLAAAAATPAPIAQGDRLFDVGSRRFAAAKWSTTALAGVSIGAGVVLYVLARDHAHSLEDDATGCGAPPCQQFDSFDRDIERTGKLEQTLANVALVGGVAIAAIAGYLWVRELTAPRSEPTRSARRTRPMAPAATWYIAPVLGPSLGPIAPGAARAVGFTGATAAVRF